MFSKLWTKKKESIPLEKMEEQQQKETEAKLTEKFISIKAYSGYSLTFADPEATEFLLAPDVSNEELGKVVIESLHQSRFLDLEKAYELEDKCRQDYPRWIERLMTRYGYKTKSALFRRMLSCGISWKGEEIIMTPTHQDQLEGWEGNSRTERLKVQIPDTSSYEEIGAALCLALSHCTSKY